jgi:CO dehydrogenase maturation factor
MVLGAIQAGNKGCACAENTVLKRLLTKLLLKADQAVLLDMEAGVEHLGRGTIAGVDHLLVVVIPSTSSIRTALKIQKLAQDVRIPKVSFVGNSVMGPADEGFIEEQLKASLIASFPDAPEIRQAERRGLSIGNLAAAFAEPLEKIVTAVRK